MASPSAVSCVNTDLPQTVSCAPSSCPVLVLTKVVRQVVWGHENKALFFSKQMCSKDWYICITKPHNRLALFSLSSYHRALPPADNRARIQHFFQLFGSVLRDTVKQAGSSAQWSNQEKIAPSNNEVWLFRGRWFCDANESLFWTHLVCQEKGFIFMTPGNLLDYFRQHQNRETTWRTGHCRE